MKQILLIPVLLLSMLSFGQKCVKKNNLSFAARMKKYPFNVAAQVQMIGYDGMLRMSEDGRDFYVDKDFVKMPILETKTLTPVQIDSLTSILYNYGYAYPPRGYKTEDCYDPHNAIIFRDQKGKPLEFIEICFECKNTTLSDWKKMSLGDMCDQKLDLLEKLFQQAGIQSGVK
ncbi:hypothetical protein [Chitinophaga silvisoli]|nr:hypothetical protein [Chitinophaga silvisoli]